jgi:signal transduction histidine kinase
VTNAGHELKTPLAIIMANTEALELYTGESKWTRNIKDQTKRLSGLMQNLLTLSKMDEPDLKLPKDEFDLGKLLIESAAPFEEPARKKKIRFSVDAAPVTVRANRDSMGQLLGILFDNAVKYTPEGGVISAGIRTENKYVILEQRNSIDPADAVEDPGRLFERFYRSDSSRTRKKGGYGIGLSAARAIAQANGAEIGAMYTDQETIVFSVIIMV